ncbi:hypothetical protein AUEXF2481DRAFT_36429 [Aureobasidium subglaciale EXF-2481]|uniref:Uncharacterized protein n=1 Tax=Aureobasidium subglaciale (strain EXF-2481) TaxID=1043005 RepID=A0A074ZL60_AURSE|nr:uncharacterized protein AUEXF2481DRAFT_36429 [Aureobasidium subglaciale EXF-2481]KAI5207544.1 hypothetical protein E4T38_03197 [Aureobasidium subglaciale]KAI5226476.1 hypothetical protein E4T40_02971 [Aureobasidium subglaciale]KAI5229899.1 hypothetical protein E4T41_03194 [Aureobasidium subglaciale]KAI5264355.1 hypothetical protein E4T46_02972 [Aureobasidium subglaciale]KEQ99131.1 hypothetical protein AUEXF2481DRAFT_36429 [Aureobasidium subglaciale EXF-2481]
MTSLNLQRLISPMALSKEDALIPSSPIMPAPLKMHSVLVETRPLPEAVDISLPPSPMTEGPSPMTEGPSPINPSPIESDENEHKPLRKSSALETLRELNAAEQKKQQAPAIPPKSAHRGAKKTSWLSKLIGRVSCSSISNGSSVDGYSMPNKPVTLPRLRKTKSTDAKRGGGEVGRVERRGNIDTGLVSRMEAYSMAEQGNALLLNHPNPGVSPGHCQQ